MDRQQAEPDPPQNQREPFIKIEQISMNEVLNMMRPKQEPVYSPQSGPDVNIETRAGAELEALPVPSGLTASNPSKQLYSTFQVQRPVFNDDNQEIRVAQCEAAVKNGLSFLHGCNTLMEKYMDVVPECKEWQEKFRSTLAEASMPRILVGILGSTGAGKSSLLNAILDENSLVPCNAMRASTAVPVEVAWNTSTKPEEAYRAEIEFISCEEWAAELKIFADDIRNSPEDDELEGKSTADAKVSYDKIAAVYPGRKVLELIEMASEELLEEADLSKYLGKIMTIKDEKPKSFSRSIRCYIDSSNKGSGREPALWPLIRSVRVYTKSPLLEYGLVLVDLPGLGDQNAARRRVTEDYIQRLHHMWIVADIVRAIDNQVAKDLLGESFKRQLLMDGRYDDEFVTFIMTKTDQIDNDEVIMSLQLKKVLKEELKDLDNCRAEMRKINKKLSNIQRREKEIAKALKLVNADIKALTVEENTFTDDSQEFSPTTRKRKHEEIERPESNQLSKSEHGAAELKKQRLDLLASMKSGADFTLQLKQKLFAVDRERNALYAAIRAVCIQKRNEWAQEQVRSDFEGGIQEYSQELLDKGTRLAKTKPQVASSANLQTFCISTKAYQQLCGRLKRDNLIEGFSNVELTKIPALQEHALKSTLPERERIANGVLDAMHSMNQSLITWAVQENNEYELSRSQKQQLTEEIKNHVDAMLEQSRNALRTAIADLQDHRKKSIDPVLQRVVNSSEKRVDQAYCRIVDARLPGITWKAISVRNGVFKNKRGEHDWNSLFARILLKLLAPQWNRYINTEIPRIHLAYSTIIIEGLQLFSKELEKSFARICGKSFKPLEAVLVQIEALQKQVCTSIKSSIRFEKTEAMKIHRDVAPKILEHMQPFYNKCAVDRGKGMTERLKQFLAQHLTATGKKMFIDCEAMILERLGDVTTMIAGRLTAAAHDAYGIIEKDLNQIIKDAVLENSGERTSEMRIELQKAVLDQLKRLSQVWDCEDLHNGPLQLSLAKPAHKTKSSLYVSSSDDESDSNEAGSQAGEDAESDDSQSEFQTSGADDGENE